MPLYMDIHTVDSDAFSVEDVVKAHMEDLAIQDKFGVTQLKYWVNEEAKTIFCLMQGPDKEACHQVHAQSHGNTACNIIEVSDNEYNLFMGLGTEVNDLAKTESGNLDTGYRTILLANIVCVSGGRKDLIEEVYTLIEKYKGVLVIEPFNEIMVSFIYASDAVLCAKAIKELCAASKDKVEFNLAVSSGKPVDEYGENMFQETKKKVHSLCSLGLSKKVYIDRETQLLSEKEPHQKKPPIGLTIVQNEDVKLALELSEAVTNNLTRSHFKSEDLSALLGLSKSQTYRKIKSLTALAPNQLIQESRLQKALNDITRSEATVAEIAYDCGFNSPTYFTRVFKKRFGISPTEFAKQQA